MLAIQMIAIGKKLSNIYSGITLPICRKYGINQTSFDVLMFCANNPERNTARDICAVRGIKSGMASVAVETLIKSGLMVRQEDLSDRRIHRLIPTEKAEPIIEDGHRVQQDFVERLKRGIDEEESTAFKSFMEKIIKNADDFGKE